MPKGVYIKTAEHKEKLRLASIENAKTNLNYGMKNKKHSVDARQGMSAAHKNVKLSLEHCNAISESRIKNMTSELRYKCGNATRSTHRSEETKIKIGKGVKARIKKGRKRRYYSNF